MPSQSFNDFLVIKFVYGERENESLAKIALASVSPKIVPGAKRNDPFDGGARREKGRAEGS